MRGQRTSDSQKIAATAEDRLAALLFVQEGAKESGKPVYVTLESGKPFMDGPCPGAFREGFAAVEIGGFSRFIDKSGRLLSQRGFKAVTDFQDGLALVWLEDGVGFLGKDGKLLPTPWLDTLSEEHEGIPDMLTGFNEGLALMRSRTADNEEVAVILDKSGSIVKVVGGAEIDVARNFTDGLAVVSKNGKFGFIDKSGHVVIPFEFSYALPFKEGRAAVMIKKYPNDIYNGKWGFIDKSGKLVVNAKYDLVGDFSEGLAAVKNGGKYGFIDKDGNIKINLSYGESFAFSDGLAVVRQGKLYGAIDKTGQVVIQFLYSWMDSFVNGLAPFHEASSNRSGYVDKTGKVVIAAQFIGADSFSDGLAQVRQRMDLANGIIKYTYINTKGQTVLWFYLP